jgi:hypothetical protein
MMLLNTHYASSLETNMRVTNGIPLGCPLLLLPVDTVNSVQTLKAPELCERLLTKHCVAAEMECNGCINHH